VRLNGDVVEEVTFRGKGCAISLSAASMMTEAVRGRRAPEVREVMAAFRGLMAAAESEEDDYGSDLGDLAVMRGVKQYPARIKCATLCWDALEEALEEAVRDEKG
jgi:nitrogen fixation NifU-like protein